MILSALILSAALAQAPTQTPAAQPTPKPTPPKLPTGKYTILKISGDLDSDQFIRTIFAELDRARGVALIILELDGNRARPDLIARLGARIADNSPPVAILLKDSADKRVGVGQALLGGFVKKCFIDPDTHIVSSPDDDLRYLAPAETKWETIDQEITGPLWRRLTDLSADQTLPQVLIAPSQDSWAIPFKTGEPWKLSSTSPAGGQSGPQPRQIAWIDGPRIDIDADTAVGLRLCANTFTGMGSVLTASNLSPRSSSSKRTGKSGLPDAAATITHIVDDSKLSVRRIATTLTIKSTPTVPTTDDYRRAGKSALDQIDRATRELDRADTLLSEFPELNRRRDAKPSRADKGPWRAAIDDLRKDLDKHRTTARDFSSR